MTVPLALSRSRLAATNHDAAAGGEHDAGAQDEQGERRLLAIAEARLAFDFENGRNGDAERALELPVGVDELLVEPAGELAAERGLARARKSHQIQIAPMQIHRGIVEEFRRAGPARRGAAT